MKIAKIPPIPAKICYTIQSGSPAGFAADMPYFTLCFIIERHHCISGYLTHIKKEYDL